MLSPPNVAVLSRVMIQRRVMRLTCVKRNKLCPTAAGWFVR